MCIIETGNYVHRDKNGGNIHILSNNTSYTKTIDMPQTLQRKSKSKYKQKN